MDDYRLEKNESVLEWKLVWWLGLTMPTFLFRCPITKSPVHGIVVQETPSDDPNSYVSVKCLACAQIHLVNLKTGKTVGEESKG